MTSGCYCFGQFLFSPAERQLFRGTERLELNSRYVDALNLLLRERGRLVTKESFLDEVWRGVPVTDEALSQCIRMLRRQLGDDAARPIYIETIPKHGYRFIADVQLIEGKVEAPTLSANAGPSIGRVARYAGAGGAIAGIGGGLFYGLTAAPVAGWANMGAMSILLVMLALNISVGAVAGLGVGCGIAASGRVPLNKWQVSTAGGMIGGLVIGGVAKLVGLDAFSLLFGRSPELMTGPAEGALLGAAIGLAVWFARDRSLSVGMSSAVGGMAGAGAGLLIPLLGGHLLGGSLNLLTERFPDARFRLDFIGHLLGEQGFGQLSEIVTSTIEGGLFGLGVAGAMALVMRPTRDDNRVR